MGLSQALRLFGLSCALAWQGPGVRRVLRSGGARRGFGRRFGGGRLGQRPEALWRPLAEELCGGLGVGPGVSDDGGRRGLGGGVPRLVREALGKAAASDSRASRPFVRRRRRRGAFVALATLGGLCLGCELGAVDRSFD